jgi:4-hydroxy-4-methyl-2-oxoglutarate aldolase
LILSWTAHVTTSSDATVRQLSGCYTGVVNDVMRAMGLIDYVLPAEITPLASRRTLCGPAFTVEGRPVPGAGAQRTLLEWTGVLSQAKPGHIWVCQPNDQLIALMGELSAQTLKARGMLGCVIDGNVRDVQFIRKLDFQCWRRRQSPLDIVDRWLPTGVDVPITIGDVLIRPGDYLIGDSDGMIRVPMELVEKVAEQAAAAMKTENMVRKAILEGMDPQQAYLRYGKF